MTRFPFEKHVELLLHSKRKKSSNIEEIGIHYINFCLYFTGAIVNVHKQML